MTALDKLNWRMAGMAGLTIPYEAGQPFSLKELHEIWMEVQKYKGIVIEVRKWAEKGQVEPKGGFDDAQGYLLAATDCEQLIDRLEGGREGMTKEAGSSRWQGNHTKIGKEVEK